MGNDLEESLKAQIDLLPREVRELPCVLPVLRIYLQDTDAIRKAGQIAQEINRDYDSTYRAMDALVEAGILKREGIGINASFEAVVKENDPPTYRPGGAGAIRAIGWLRRGSRL